MSVIVDWHPYWVWLAVASIVAFLLYGFDKLQAKWDGWRVPEIVLSSLALSGGFPGGWIGRSLFRHKTQKRSFTFVLAFSAVIHLGVIYYLFLR